MINDETELGCKLLTLTNAIEKEILQVSRRI